MFSTLISGNCALLTGGYSNLTVHSETGQQIGTGMVAKLIIPSINKGRAKPFTK